MDISTFLRDESFDIIRGITPPMTLSPKWTPQKLIYWLAPTRPVFFFDIITYLTDKYFDIVWGANPPKKNPKYTPKKQFFEQPNLRCQCIFISVDI